MTAMGNQIGDVEQLRERGHWLVNLRPGPYEVARASSLGGVESVLERTSVQLRGWDFPHIDRTVSIERRGGYITQASKWANYVEEWQLHKSGQFAGRVGMEEDWWDEVSDRFAPRRPSDWETQPYLGVTNTVYHYTEFFLFASNLATSELGGSNMVVNILASGLAGRHLYADDPRRTPMRRIYEASIDSLRYSVTVTHDQLLGEWQELARTAVLELFEQFGWEPDSQIVSTTQEELYRFSNGLD